MSKKKKFPFKEMFELSIWAIKITWRISPFISIASLITIVYKYISPLINAYIIAKIVDQIINLKATEGTGIEGIVPLLVMLGVVQLISILSTNVERFVNRLRRQVTDPYLTRMEYEKLHSLGVQTVQLPSVANKIQVAHEFLYGVTEVNQTIIRLTASLIQSIVAGVVVIAFSWWIGAIVIVISIISFLQNRYYFIKIFEWQVSKENVQERRKAWMTGFTLSKPETQDEISLVGGLSFLDKKYSNFFDNYIYSFKKLLKADSITNFGVELLNLLIVLGGTIHVFLLALRDVITVGDTTFYISSINNFYSGLSRFTTELVIMNDILNRQREVYGFFNMKPAVEDGSVRMERLMRPPSIEFRNVSFHYPNTSKNIFENFSLKIGSGDKVAIVGENGAGKSTVIKLLCRIYDPQEGEILVNGINLKDLSINDWYKNIGVLFQDYNFYQFLTVEENIYIGKSVKEIDRERLVESAKNADAHSFIMKYKKGYKTVMTERFKDGINPSTGQKQKIAIARFFYRDAPLAIFDEPTSAIDADAEYKIFNRIYNFFENKTVIIISHRFSTVRNADTIFVIKEGKIIENGTHSELLSMNGVYADNFIKQAEGYQN